MRAPKTGKRNSSDDRTRQISVLPFIRPPARGALGRRRAALLRAGHAAGGAIGSHDGVAASRARGRGAGRRHLVGRLNARPCPSGAARADGYLQSAVRAHGRRFTTTDPSSFLFSFSIERSERRLASGERASRRARRRDEGSDRRQGSARSPTTYDPARGDRSPGYDATAGCFASFVAGSRANDRRARRRFAGWGGRPARRGSAGAARDGSGQVDHGPAAGLDGTVDRAALRRCARRGPAPPLCRRLPALDALARPALAHAGLPWTCTNIRNGRDEQASDWRS
jgi:hypothetical protein